MRVRSQLQLALEDFDILVAASGEIDDDQLILRTHFARFRAANHFRDSVRRFKRWKNPFQANQLDTGIERVLVGAACVLYAAGFVEHGMLRAYPSVVEACRDGVGRRYLSHQVLPN